MPGSDVLTIGGGPAGYVAGIRAAQLGGKVTIVEKDRVGGTCLNRGCIPTKALLEYARLFTRLRKLGITTIDNGKPLIDLPEIIRTKESVVERIGKSTERLLDSYGIEVLHGVGRITGQTEIEVNGETDKRRISANNLIIATGSSPASLRVPGSEAKGMIIGEEILKVSEVPSRLVIIGGGGIGVEFGCIFNALGSKVTILELMPRIIPNEDPDISRYLRELLERRGITIKTDARVKEIAYRSSARLSVEFSSANNEEEAEADKVLVSIGRKPNTQDLGLENLNIAVVAGWIKTDSHMKTNVPHIFAAGDIVGRYQFAYTASAEGVIAAENALGGNSEINYSLVPRCTFSDPQVASVGLTENQARANNLNVKVGMFSFADNSRALTMGEEDGGAKIVTDSVSGEILGVHIIGPEAAELIGGVAFAMKLEATVQDIGDMMYIHPTLSEALKEAALDVEDRAVHRVKKSPLP